MAGQSRTFGSQERGAVMNGWMTLWKVFFIVAIGSFALLSVWVILAGMIDIKQMFKDLRKLNSEKEK